MTPAQVAAALGCTMAEAAVLIEALEREIVRANRVNLRYPSRIAQDSSDRSLVAIALRQALRMLFDGLYP